MKIVKRSVVSRNWRSKRAMEGCGGFPGPGNDTTVNCSVVKCLETTAPKGSLKVNIGLYMTIRTGPGLQQLAILAQGVDSGDPVCARASTLYFVVVCLFVL